MLAASVLFGVSACGNVEENSETITDTQTYISQEIWGEEASFIDFTYDEIEKKLALLELPSNDVLAQISMEDTEIIDSYEKISDGYAVVKSTYDEKVANARSINGMLIVTGISKEKELYEYIYYDDTLQEKEVIDLKSMLTEEVLREIEESQADARIESSGQKVAWSTKNGMYVLDIKNGQLETHALESDGFSYYEIAFIDENKLGFYQTKGEVDVDTRYGYWDLETNELFYEETDYMPYQMRVSGTYLILNDGEDLETNCSSGKVLVYDCKQKQGNTYFVDNTESTFACVTSDGKNLIAYTCMNEELTKHRVRVYQLSNGQCISEKNFTSEYAVRFYDFCNAQKEYSLIGLGEAGKVMYHAFTIE